MARVSASLSDDEVVGSNGVIRRVELVQMVQMSLFKWRLEEESGIPLRSAAVELFMYQIREGQWAESVSMRFIYGTDDRESIFSGLTDKSISLRDLEGNELNFWNGLMRTTRIVDLGITMDGKELITVCKENTIMLFEWETKSEKITEEEQPIISFALSEDKKLLLVSLANEELHLWNLDGCTRPVAKYKGHKRSRFVVRSCFGGLEQTCISSGSEDSQVYIWHRRSGELVLTLAGHSGAVNCVSWNPSNPQMLASASDDRTIRIWGLNQVNMNHSMHSNGVDHCNGGT